MSPIVEEPTPDFDRYESIAEQFNLDSALQSRFDLIFTMKDKPDEDRDGRIVDTILDSHEVGQRIERGEVIGDPGVEPAIEPEVLRAYIAHAKTITPVVTEETKAAIREQYLTLRQANDDDGPVPVTPRASEALIRLAEASARIRLSEEIIAEDAARAARLHQSCLEDVGIDPDTGEFDVDIVETGESMSQRKRIKTIETIIDNLNHEEELTHGAPYDEICSVAADFEISTDQVDHAIDKLRNRGDLYQPQDGNNPTYRLT